MRAAPASNNVFSSSNPVKGRVEALTAATVVEDSRTVPKTETPDETPAGVVVV